MKSQRLNQVIVWAITGVLVGLTGLLMILFASFTGSLSPAEQDTSYEKYYVIITDNSGSSFWQSVYSAALSEAKEHNAYVEMISDNLSRDYSASELMEIA